MHSSRIEQSRRALVETAADILQDIARAKKLHVDALAQAGGASTTHGTPPGTPAAPGGDLLVDFVRLQVDYVLRLGELGRTHRDHAFRTLEFLYRAVVPAKVFDPSAAAHLQFSTSEPAQAFVVENREAQAGELTLQAIVPNELRATFYLLAADGHTKEALSTGPVPLPLGTCVKILLELAHIDQLPGGVHDGQVKLSFANRPPRSLAVRIVAAQVPKVEL